MLSIDSAPIFISIDVRYELWYNALMIDIKERRRDKQDLYKQVIQAGGKPAKNNTFLCPFHDDKTPSSWIKQSKDGYYYFRCGACGIVGDVWDIEARNRNITVEELFIEASGAVPPPPKYQTYYKTLEELVESLDSIAIEEINPYSDPITGNLDLVTIRYLARGESRKQFAQGYQSPKGFVRKRPSGVTPLFNRKRVIENDTIILVEGEKCVRILTKCGFTSTTNAGGANNVGNTDYSLLAGKSLYLWRDFDVPGQTWEDGIKVKLAELDPLPVILTIKVDQLELPEGGDAYDLYEKVIFEGGTKEDFQSYVETLLEDAAEDNQLEEFETLLDDMRSGKYSNLPLSDFPILTNEAALLLNKRIGIIYGGAGLGKSLFISKFCDDLVLDEHKVARLQLEDELSQHQLRTFAQQLQRSELANPEWHKANPEASKVFYEHFRPTMDILSKSIICGEHENWDVDKILLWIEQQLKSGKELVVIDPVSVIMTEKIWITSHSLMWKTKKLLAQYPNGRVVFVSHNNTEGEVAGGQAFRRFCHTLLMMNKYKKPKNVKIVDKNGEIQSIVLDASIGIAKSRYGKGGGLEVAIKINPNTLCLDEIGIVLEEEKVVRTAGRNLDPPDADIDL